MEIPYIFTPRKDTGLVNSKIAIWLFLASEVMLFGGFFPLMYICALARIIHGQNGAFRCFLV